MSILTKQKGIIVAFDMEDIGLALHLAKQLRNLKGNFAIKIGRPLEMQRGRDIISQVKSASQLPIIYDGKIADIPYISAKIARIAYQAGADAVIIHPFTGRDVVKEIVNLQMGDVIAIVEMTHPGSSQYIDQVSEEIAKMVNGLDVQGVVLPATKPRSISRLSGFLRKDVYIISPGIKAQGAKVGDAIKNGADYEVVGRAIYEASQPHRVAEDIYKQILNQEK